MRGRWRRSPPQEGRKIFFNVSRNKSGDRKLIFIFRYSRKRFGHCRECTNTAGSGELRPQTLSEDSAPCTPFCLPLLTGTFQDIIFPVPPLRPVSPSFFQAIARASDSTLRLTMRVFLIWFYCNCFYIRSHISATTYPNFTKFYVHDHRGRGSVLL